MMISFKEYLRCIITAKKSYEFLGFRLGSLTCREFHVTKLQKYTAIRIFVK
jgi:hypothetical protein